jgi:ornithine cyclodeaminase/alanine dehydrogenase-like protein (mu-crystallin family)
MIADNELLYLSESDVLAACAESDPVTCVHDALTLHARGEVVLPDEAYLGWQAPDGSPARSLNMPAGLLGATESFGTKIINANPANVTRGLPRASGLTLLYNPTTARPVAIMEATRISALRTAAVSFLAARAAWAQEPATVAALGAGPIARTHLEMLAYRTEGLARIVIHDAVPGRAAALARELAPLASERGYAIDVEPEARSAVAAATLVVAATTTTTPYIEMNWLKPGTVVLNVSLDDVTAEVLLGAGRLYVDDWGLICADRNRLLGRLARDGRACGPGETVSGARPVDGTIGQLLLGECPGRDSAEDIIVVNPFGMAICDIAIARQVRSVALRRGLGVRLQR